MKILSILPFSPPSSLIGGAERQIYSMHKGLRARGIDLHVLAEISNVGKANEPPAASGGELDPKRFKWATLLWWFGGGLVCALLNLGLVPRYSGLGAAISQSVSFAFISLGILAISQAKYRIQLDWSQLV